MENQMNLPPRGQRNSAQTYKDGAYDGNPQTEILERTRRVETRVTNVLRSLGLQPGLNSPEAYKGMVGFVPSEQRGLNDALLISNPQVPVAAISTCAVLNTPTGEDKTFDIVLSSQLWGQITIRGADSVSPKSRKRA